MINTCLSCLFLEEQREFEYPRLKMGFHSMENGNSMAGVTACVIFMFTGILVLYNHRSCCKLHYFNYFNPEYHQASISLNFEHCIMQGTMHVWGNISSLMGLNGAQTRPRQVGAKKKARLVIARCSMNIYLLMMFLMLSGDVCPNPGPVKNPCTVCFRPVAKNYRAVSCDGCYGYSHIKCEGLSYSFYKDLCKLDQFPWMCRACCAGSLPFVDDENISLQFKRSEWQRTQSQVLPEMDNTYDEVNHVYLDSIINKSGLKMLHININGLLGKLDFVKLIAERTKFDVFSVNETKIDEDIDDEDISLQGYKIFRKDRNQYGGGFLIYVSKALESFKMDELEEEHIEGVWAKICLRRSTPIVVGSIYRPPRSGSDFRDMEVLHAYLDQVKLKLRKTKEIYIFGDLNCNMLRKNGLSSIINICNTLGAVQLINEPMRETESTASLIDILITTKEECLGKSGVIKTSISDHYMLYAIRKGKKIRFPPRILESRSFKNFNPEEFTKDLASQDWSELYHTSDVNECAKIFTGNILQAADKHAPKRTIRVKGTVHNMFSDELIALMKERCNGSQASA